MSGPEFPPDEFRGHEELIAELRATTLDAPEHLHRRVLADAPVKRRWWREMSSRRQALVVVGAAATLALGAAVVQGAFFSGSSSQAAPNGPVHQLSQFRDALAVQQRHYQHEVARMQRQYKQDVARMNARQAALGYAPGSWNTQKSTGALGPQGPQGPTGANGPTGLTGPSGTTEGSLAAGKAYNGYATALPAATHGSPSLSGVAIPKHRLVHAAASLQVDVATHRALTADTDKASQIVTNLGGYAQSVNYSASNGNYGSSHLDLRVPVHQADTAIRQLSGLGTLTFKTVATQDLQQRFHAQVTKIGSLQRAIQVYEKALADGSVTGTQRVQVEIALANARHQLTYQRQAKTATIKYGATAQILLTLRLAPHHAAVVHPTKRGRLGRLLHNIGGVLGLEGIIVLYILVIGIPIVLVIALLWWIVRERRRREERLLAANA